MQSRIALVTGGTGGIGTAICKRLASMGHKVATNSRNLERGQEWQAKMKADGFAISVFPGDVSDVESARTLVESIANELCPIGILVNNDGITRDTTFHRMSALQWQEVLNTNLTAKSEDRRVG